MSSAAFAFALGLAIRPDCGGAAPDSEFARRLAAIAVHESGGDPLVVGVNGPGGGARHFSNAADATVFATAAIARGMSIDLGLMQINSGQLARHGLTITAAFDACRSMRAGADHYAADVRAVWNLAARRYNTGTTTRGAAYAASVEQILDRQEGVPPSPAPVASPAEPVAPPAPLCAPAWDAWALASCAGAKTTASTQGENAP